MEKEAKTTLSYDGRQLITRIPKKIEERHDLKQGDKMLWASKKEEIILRGLYKTDIEKIMAKALFDAGIKAIYNYPIRCKYGYMIDFAIPESKIAIECDGEKWHPKNNAHDRKRDAYLKSKGWKIFRFRSKEIKDNVQLCVEKIKYYLVQFRPEKSS